MGEGRVGVLERSLIKLLTLQKFYEKDQQKKNDSYGDTSSQNN